MSENTKEIKEKGDDIVRNFDHTYVLIYCNDEYGELRKIMPGMSNLKWAKNDLVNARATAGMMSVQQENIYEFVNSTWDEIKKAELELHSKIVAHAAAGETVIIYAYFAGHGCSDVRQYFLLNESEPKKAMYKAEEQLRMRSLAGRSRELGKVLCHVVAVYDICRLQSDADKIKKLLE